MRFGTVRQSFRTAVHHFGNNYRTAYKSYPPHITAALCCSFSRMHPQLLRMVDPHTINSGTLSSILKECALGGKSTEVSFLDLSPADWLKNYQEEYQSGGLCAFSNSMLQIWLETVRETRLQYNVYHASRAAGKWTRICTCLMDQRIVLSCVYSSENSLSRLSQLYIF